MNKKLGWVIGALVAVLLMVGAYGVSSAYADDNDPPKPLLDGRGPREHRGGPRLDGAALEAVAGVLKMEPAEVTAALEGGKTLQDLADAVDVDMQEITDALNAVLETEIRDRITQAVEDGNITQEHADWLLEGLDKGFLNGPGFGFGFRRHPGKGAPPALTE